MTVTVITEGDPPTTETVGYGDLPPRIVRQFAEDGDPDAAAWLADHPDALTADADFEGKHPRGPDGRFGEGDEQPERPPPWEITPHDRYVAAIELMGIPKKLWRSGPDSQFFAWQRLAWDAKRGVAENLATHMRSSTEDLVDAARVTGYGNDLFRIGRTESGDLRSVKEELTGLPDFGSVKEWVRSDDPAAEPLYREMAASRLVQNWAYSSNDTDETSLAIQRAATEEFGLDRVAGWDVDAATRDVVKEEYDQHGDVYRDFLRTQYDATQRALADAHVDGLTLQRGYTWVDANGNDIPPPAWARHEGTADLPTRPLSSWSSEQKIATTFAGGSGSKGAGNIITERIPAERILSFPRTGMGALHEREFVVLGGIDRVTNRQYGRWPKSLTADAAFEEKHPRDAHGRFGEGGPDAFMPGSPDMLVADPRYKYDSDVIPVADQSVGLRLLSEGKDVATSRFYTERERLKIEVAHEIASRMTDVDPLAMVTAVAGTTSGPYTNVLAGGGLAAVREEMRSGISYPSDYAVLARVLTDPPEGLYAKVITPNIGAPVVSWMDTRAVADQLTDKDRAEIARDWVRPDDPRVAQAVRENAVDYMVGQWAQTSNDSNAWALSLQESATKEFGLSDALDWERKPTAVPDPETGAHRSFEQYHADVEPVQREFLRAMYENTQEHLAAAGVTSVPLARGYQFFGGGDYGVPDWSRQTGEAAVPLRPLSAWSSSGPEAVRFGKTDTGAVVVADVPASRVLSYARTGLGTLAEQEFVVLGGTDRVNVVKAVPSFADGITADGFDESKHPRNPAGSPGGGEFVSPDQSSAPEARLAASVPTTTEGVRDQIVAGIRDRFTTALGDYPQRYAEAKAISSLRPAPSPENTAEEVYRNVRDGVKWADTYDRNLVKAFVDDDKRALGYITRKQDDEAKGLMVESVRPEYAAAFKEAIGQVNADSHMQQVMGQYGVPDIRIAAANGGGLDDPNIPNGTYQSGENVITLYENAFDRVEGASPQVDWPHPKPEATTVSGGFTTGTLTHEYGHYVHSQLTDEQQNEWGKITRERFAEYDKAAAANPRMTNDRTISYYAMVGNGTPYSRTQESFGETFAAVMHPDYKRSDYDPSNHAMLQFMEGIVGPKPPPTLFSHDAQAFA